MKSLHVHLQHLQCMHAGIHSYQKEVCQFRFSGKAYVHMDGFNCSTRSWNLALPIRVLYYSASAREHLQVSEIWLVTDLK